VPLQQDSLGAELFTGQLSNENFDNVDLLNDPIEEIVTGDQSSLVSSTHQASALGRSAASTAWFYAPSWAMSAASIPRSLRPLQMPEVLVDSVEQGFLWSYFIHSVAPAVVPSDDIQPATESHVNPILLHLPRLAFTHRHLLNAILAYSAIRYDRALRKQKFTALQRELLHESQKDLATWLGSSDTDRDSIPAAMATTLLLCLYQLALGAGHNWYVHLQGARSIAASMTAGQPSLAGVEHDLYLFLMNFLGYAEIVTRLSPGSVDPCSNALTNVLRSINQPDSLDVVSGVPFQIRRLVHPVLLFSRRLVDPLLKLGSLIKRKQSLYSTVSGISMSSPDLQSLHAEIDELENTLLATEEADQADLSNGTSDPDDSLLSNESFHAAAFLLFYARLRDLPSTHGLIRRRVREIVLATKGCRSATMLLAMILPLFTAGCEAVESSDREEVQSRFREMGPLCLCDGERLMVVLTAIWEVRDQSPAMEWWKWQAEVEGRLGFCVVF
jgi:hypothetical protein